MIRQLNLLLVLTCLGTVHSPASARRVRQAPAPLALVTDVAAQPVLAQADRIAEALAILGAPLSRQEAGALAAAHRATDDAKAVSAVQSLLDKRCIAGITINPESRVKLARGPADANLLEQGWRIYLVKVHNEAGVTAPLALVSPNAQSVFDSGGFVNASDRALRPRMGINGNDRHTKPTPSARTRWMDLALFNKQPMNPTLSGLKLDYAIIQIYSRDSGSREGKLIFSVGQGRQDPGFRNEIDLLFEAKPSSDLTLNVRDEHGQKTTAMYVIKDSLGRVYPSQAKRLAPDFAFHPQVYRDDGGTVRLPKGAYTITCARGPEYLPETRPFNMPARAASVAFQLKRWIDPAKDGWWSGDHHIHAAGCAHYDNPSEGVHAPDMALHCRGEDLKIGSNLTWGPCFDYQKQFFTGKDDKVSQYPYLLRYDIEVSGFGSHQSGHLCLLRLKDQMYPGGDSWKHWPTLGLNTLKWAKKQGAVTGPAHSGNGLGIPPGPLPSEVVPRFDGIGAIEYIVDVTHMVEGPDGKPTPAIDFMSTVDTPYENELNIWYHTLNCGYRTRISGETDFPCISGERVGMGRSYVKLPGKLDYESWCEGIRQGKCYVSDGMSHLMNFRVGSRSVGDEGSELRMSAPGNVRVRADVGALLGVERDPTKPQGGYWHLERARIGSSREVPVEVLVNGKSVGQRTITADGATREVAFDIPIARSAWVAMRILGSSHTNPVFVLVGDKPIRGSQKSAEWCIKAVEQCWSQKQRTYRPEEMADAVAAYDHARREYRRILEESNGLEP